ncbi:TetR/AcrR family transcriptional regulator [Streptomyces sp. NPDC020747]|uniref:TetR/AcrR family transcriptional regulator n=1 Tax=Streptomyces sp. NPDC020747 TaxID=3365086 RepID=UPI0037B3B41A
MHNRARILAAAQESLAELGPEAALDEIARRAAVGNATLYRHFPSREDLLAAVLEQVAVNGADAAEEAAAQEDDPYSALCHFARAVALQRLAALCCLSGELMGARPELSLQKERFVQAAQRLLSHAQQAGQVRADVSLEEVMAALAQLSRPLPGTSWSAADQVSPFTVQMYLDGLLVRADV